MFKLAIMNYVSSNLSSKSISSYLSSNENESMESYFSRLLELILQHITQSGISIRELSATESKSSKALTFSQAFLKISYETLDKVNALLSIPLFFNVSLNLLDHKDLSVNIYYLFLYSIFQIIKNQSFLKVLFFIFLTISSLAGYYFILYLFRHFFFFSHIF